jgi:hypothetical protein
MMNARMDTNHPDMFHDVAAHRLEWRLAVPAIVAAAIVVLYGLMYAY